MAYYRCNGGNGGGGGTPEAYIYNVDRCSFNTGHKHTQNTKIIMKAHFFESWWITSSGYMTPWGARKGGYGNNSFGFFSRFNDSKFCFFRTGQEVAGHKFNEAESNSDLPCFQTPVILSAEGKTASWVNVDTLVSKSLTANNGVINDGVAPLGLFCDNNSSAADGWDPVDFCYMKLYYFEIYESGELIHRFVPAFDNNQYCLYDEIEQVYKYDLTNNGSYVRGFIPS